MKIRRFEPADAGAVSDLIVKTLRVSNTKDYPPEQMEALILHQQPADVMQRASWTHFYVAEEEGRSIGCGAIGPECQGRGVGKKIVETLERDEYALRARRIEIPASITGLPFYRKMGYGFKDGAETLDGEGLYRLEKIRSEAGEK